MTLRHADGVTWWPAVLASDPVRPDELERLHIGLIFTVTRQHFDVQMCPMGGAGGRVRVADGDGAAVAAP